MKNAIYHFTMARSHRALKQRYGKEFWTAFKKQSKDRFDEILLLTPDIGKSVFAFNFEFGPAYIAWYKALIELGLMKQEAWKIIWLMNEKMITAAPRFLLHLTGKSFLYTLRKEAAAHEERQRLNKLHPYDWRITYKEIDGNTFEVDITECGLKKLAHDFEADGLLPGICRMDYLFSNLLGNGFERTKTLGDGDDCCNCRYNIVGSCDWSPKKGFADRK